MQDYMQVILALKKKNINSDYEKKERNYLQLSSSIKARLAELKARVAELAGRGGGAGESQHHLHFHYSPEHGQPLADMEQLSTEKLIVKDTKKYEMQITEKPAIDIERIKSIINSTG